MNTHEEILERMSGANPLSDVEMITDGQLAEMTVRVEEARRSDRVLSQPQALTPVKTPVRWLRPAAAFIVALLMASGTIGIVSLVSRGGSDLADEPSPTTTGAPPPTAAPETSATPANPTNRVLDLALAGNDELWAISLGGVVQWDLATQTHTVHDEGLGDAAADLSRVMAGADGTVWFAGIGNENLARFDDGGWATFQLGDAPFSHMRPGEYMPMTVGPDGALWIAVGPDELGRFDGLEWEIFEIPYGADTLARTGASDIAVSPDGTLWAVLQGSSGEPDPESPAVDPSAVVSFDGTDWTLYTSGDGLPDGIRTITVTPDGTIWAMSFGWSWADDSGNEASVSGEGVARFDSGTWTHYTEADGLPSNDSGIVAGLDGSIWAVDITGEGISQFDGSDWTALPAPPRSGLPAVGDAAGTLWMLSDESGDGIIGVNGEDSFRLIVPLEEDPVAAPTTTIVPAPEEWNPVLADTRAGPAPPAATCPAGTAPHDSGPINQDRPEAGFNGMLAGAFDQRLGKIIYVDTGGDTWGFDVCTNTWSNLEPSGAPLAESSGLVYDVDSDLTIALGSTIGVYDADAKAWTSTPISANTGVAARDWLWPVGAVYDPVSGLVVTTQYVDNSAMVLWAYDVDTDTWTSVGLLPEVGDLLGYTPRLDRFIIATLNNRTMLLDPRSGETTIVATDTPAVDIGWPSASYGPTTDTAFVAHGVQLTGGVFVDKFPGLICGFDPGTLTWGSCFSSPGEGDYRSFGAIVGDPINDRLIVINGIYGSWWANATDHVWAVDLETGELIELLAPTEFQPTTTEDQ